MAAVLPAGRCRRRRIPYNAVLTVCGTPRDTVIPRENYFRRKSQPIPAGGFPTTYGTGLFPILSRIYGAADTKSSILSKDSEFRNPSGAIPTRPRAIAIFSDIPGPPEFVGASPSSSIHPLCPPRRPRAGSGLVLMIRAHKHPQGAVAWCKDVPQKFRGCQSTFGNRSLRIAVRGRIITSMDPLGVYLRPGPSLSSLHRMELVYRCAGLCSSSL